MLTWNKTIVILCLFLLAGGVTRMAARSERTPPYRSFEGFPLEIGTWQGSRSLLDQEIANVLGVEDYVMADYRQLDGQARLNVYIGFYRSQSQGDIIHSPRNCLPGAGWNITDTGVEEIRFEGGAEPARVARLLLEKGGARQVVLYWYQSRGRIIASEYWQKIWLVLDSIFRRRTDGSFVRLIAPVHGGEEDTLNTLKSFAREIKPHLDTFIPS